MWNVRVWQKDYAGDEPFYEIKETFYNEKGEVCGCSQDAKQIHGSSVEEIVEYLHLILRDIDKSKKEILVEKDFKFAPWSYDEELKSFNSVEELFADLESEEE